MLSIKNQLLKKQQIVQLIKKNIDESSAIIFFNFSAAENGEIFSLKKSLRKIGAEWFVFKNNLFKKAFCAKENDLVIDKNNAFIFCKGDKYKPLNVLSNFDFRFNLENRIQGGFYDDTLVSGSELAKWSNLKSREFILSEFCHLLLFNVNKFTILLDEMIANKE